MQIVEVARRRKHNVLVKTDVHEFLIDVDASDEFGLKPGLIIDDDTLTSLLRHSEFLKAKNKALWLLQMREHSKRELCDKLKKDYNREIVEEIVTLFEESGLVDDERFANMYAVELSEMRGMSRANIRRELIKKGVGRDIIDEVVDILPDDEIPAIIEIISRKYYNCFDDEKAKRRMVAALARKGYAYDDIRRAIEEYNDERED